MADIAEELRQMIDSLVAVGLKRDELPGWTAHVSEYVTDDKVYVMDPNQVDRTPMTGLLMPKDKPDPLFVIARRALSETEQEAAVRLFVAKREPAASPTGEHSNG